MRWDKVTLVGVGLLGGSIGLALRQRKLAREVHGFVRRKAAVRESIRSGAVTHAGTDLLAAVRGADLIILCTPIAQMERLAGQLIPALKKGAVVTDVGSVKAPVVRSLSPTIRKAGAQFVGSHPMAGSDNGGVRAAQPGLFIDAVCVVTPQAASGKAAVRLVERFWKSLGARVLTMDAAMHDKLVSRASHLPHLLASALAGQVLDPREDKRQATLCATGFRDTTRVACAAPEMWRDIALANRRNLIRDLARFEQSLSALRGWLTEGDVDRVERFLSEAQQRRVRWKHTRKSTSSE